MEHTSKIELSRSALESNFRYLRKLVGENCRISHVVKGNAYGHGIDTFVPLARELGADHFSTFDATEAWEIRKIISPEVPVMIMGMIDNDQMEWAIENDVEFYVFEMDRLKNAARIAKKAGKRARIHIEIETGMNRTGFEESVFPRALKFIKSHRDQFEIKGFCTHYAGAENISNFIRINDQVNRFEQGVTALHKEGLDAEAFHTAGSAAAIRLPHTRMDMVRIGILQYGFWPSRETYITTIHPKKEHSDPLKRVISWKSRVMSVKDILQGEYVGYGTSFLATTDMKIATVPVGYSHGFTRSLSNQGRALVRGQRVPVIGMVNMNMMMLDISQLDHVEKGDEVILIGKQKGLTISVSSFSEYSDQLNYELLTRLPHNIPRYIVN